jgi:hypothetical protein
MSGDITEPDNVIDLDTERLLRQLLRSHPHVSVGGDGDRCPWCGAVTTGATLLGNSLANGALPLLQEHALRAFKLYSDDMRSLQRRVRELEAAQAGAGGASVEPAAVEPAGEARSILADAKRELDLLQSKQGAYMQGFEALRSRILELDGELARAHLRMAHLELWREHQDPSGFWHSMTAEQRLDMMARTCWECGALDGCSCKRE